MGEGTQDMTKTTKAAVRRRIGLTGPVVVAASALLAGCASTGQRTALLSGAEPLERVVGPHDPVTPGGGRYQVGRPYTIGGKTYYPREDRDLDQTGVASWYGGDYHHGTRTANGEVYDRGALTAAHKTMPLPSYARVTNLNNGRSIVVRVNDRGPYVGNRIIDISEKTAELLEMKRGGVGRVRVQYVGPAGLAGSDARVLAATLRGPDVAPRAEERILVAQADLKPGPRANRPAGVPGPVAPMPAPIMVAAAVVQTPVAAPRPAPAGAAKASLFAQSRVAAAPLVRPVAFAPVADATSFELAGVDARTLRAAKLATRPASSSAAVIAAGLPAASGGPLSILPATAAGTGTVAASEGIGEATTVVASRTSSYAAEVRIAGAHAIFRTMGDGERLAALAE